VTQVERDHGRVFVRHALSYLTASKNGLSDVEMEVLFIVFLNVTFIVFRLTVLTFVT